MRLPFLSAAIYCALACLAAIPLDRPARAADDVAWARENMAAGKYKEAVELTRKALAELAEGTPERRPAALLLIDVLRIVGEYGEARGMAEALLKTDPKDTHAVLLKAELDVWLGNYKEAREAYDKVIADQPGNERAWALRTMVLRIQNDRATLKATADHFFEVYQARKEYFNSEDVKDPLELAYIAQGFQDDDPKSAFETCYMLAEDLAKNRGLRVPEIFIWSARLAHDKYHFAFADERYATVLKILPRYPDALAGRAAILMQTRHDVENAEKLLKEALAVNPRHIESHLVYAEVDLEEDRYESALKHIDAALAVNPNHLQGLAMLAYYHLDMNEPAKAQEAEKRALAINPKAADFYCDVGELMENKRGYNTATEWYQKAVDLDPEHWRGYYGLGMNLSRQGAHGEEKGKALLLKAFGKNKFNPWARNMIKALDKIIGDKEQEVPPQYAESKTKHFTLKYHIKEAAVIRPYLEEWAEAAYESQTKRFKYEPEGPLTIELCYSTQDNDARTVGLPIGGLLGVCFGKLCTVVSPREGKGNMPPFNWRKVMEHEFGHVMALQLSKYRVPRWYTEAFSTYLEDDSRIRTDQKMIDYLSRNRLESLDTMNNYFRKDMLMAYVHGRYVIEYIDKQFGFDAHIKSLQLFAEGKKLNDALQTATGKELSVLNDGQLKFVKDSFENVRLRPTYDPATLVQLELAAKAANATAQDFANLAFAAIAQRKLKFAEGLAQKALELDAKCVDALNVQGFLAFDKKDFETAKQLYMKSTGIDPGRSFAAWHRLGVIYKKEGRTTKAIEAFEAARKSYPRYVGPDNPHHELPDLYADLEPAQMDKALAVWRDAVKVNTEDAEAALKGLRLAMKMKDFKSALEFAMSHIEIDPYNPEVHREAGKACVELKDSVRAVREFSVATALNDKDVECWVGLARAQLALGQKHLALKAAQQALEVDGSNADAKALRTELQE